MSIETMSLSPKQARVCPILWFVFSIVLLLNMAVTPVTTSVVYASSTDTSQSFANNSNPICYDITGDGVVNMFDFLALTIAFGSYPGHPNWNPEADLNDDNIVDIFDAVIMNTGAHTVVERFWSADSYWRQKIPLNAPLHPNSAQMVNWLVSRHGAYPDINYRWYAGPIYDAYEDTPRVNVYKSDKKTVRMYDVPIASGWEPSGDSDHVMCIIDWDNWEFYDFWQIYHEGGVWWANAAAKFDLNSSGVSPNGHWTSGGAGVPFIAIAILPEEIEAGVINHPLGCGLNTPKKGWKVYPPASTTDGKNTDTWAIPEGARIQLDPNLDLDSLGLSRTAKIIAKALQEYGMVVKESAGAWVLQAEHVLTADWSKWGLTGGILSSLPADAWRIPDYSVFEAVEEAYP